MPENKPVPTRNFSGTILLPKDGTTVSLRLQLQKEIDKLALLIEEVKKQSDRVQAAADAIADRVLLEAPRQYSKNRRNNGVKSMDGSAIGTAKSVPDGSAAV